MSKINQCVMAAILLVAIIISGNGMAEAIDSPPGSMSIVSGSLAGQVIGSGATTINVAIDEAITGTMDVEIANWHSPAAVFPVGWTPTWGSHDDVYRSVTSHHHGTATFNIPVDLRAPSEPGEYYIFIAGQWQIGVDKVMSATHWAHFADPVWDDGNDVADWGEENYQLGDLEGWALYNQLKSDGYHLLGAPAAGIKVIVAQPVSIDIVLNDTNLTPGETLTAEAHITNDDTPDDVTAKVWVELPDGSRMSIYNIPSYHIPAHADMMVPLFSQTFNGEPAGTYQVRGRFLDTLTGDHLSTDIEPFNFTP